MSRSPSLPPEPRLPRALQTAIWFRHAQWLLSQCAARFGETFTLRILHEGALVMPARPQAEPVLRRAITEMPQRHAEVVLR